MLTKRRFPKFLIFAASALALSASSGAKTTSIASAAMHVDVSDSPFSFRVSDAAGRLLLETAGAAFTEGRFPAESATGVTVSGNSLSATLNLSRTSAKAHLTLSFKTPEVLQVHWTLDGGNAVEVLQQFRDQGEHVYGIWEYPFGGNIDNRGVDRDFMGVQTMPDVNYDSARAPFYVTSRGYGVYVESTGEGHYTIAQGGKTSFSFRGAELTFDVIYGPTYADMFKRYNALAGPSLMPPTWAFSTIWWRDDHHKDLRGVSNAQEKVIQDADTLRKLHIPASAMWLDRPYGTGEHGWGNLDFDPGFPDPAKMISDLHDRGMYLLLWIANRCSAGLFDEGTAKGYLFERQWPAADVRRPEVYNWFKDKLDAYVKMGIRGYKIDRGEEAEMPRYVENENAILFPKLASEGLRAAYGDDFLEFSRNANDTARKYTALWNGDTRPTFGGLSASIKNAQRAGAINFPMWASDTGGYLGNPNKELFARWLEFSAFSPMMEILIGPKRTIWDDFDPELVDIARTYSVVHHDLLPYTRSELFEATQSGMPVVRSLIFAYPDDQKLTTTWDEYLFGSEILVAPIVTERVTSRSVYLPKGVWLDYDNKSNAYVGPREVDASAPLNAIPLYVREGAIIPRGDILRANNNWTPDWKPGLRIEFFPGANTSSQFPYYDGQRSHKISLSAHSNSVTIQFGDLGIDGSLEIYCKSFKSVTLNGTALPASRYSFEQNAGKLTIPFHGATALEVSGLESVFSVRER